MIQLSLPYIIMGKTITSTIHTFVSEVMSLLFNMLSRFVIAFLPRDKCVLIFFVAVSIHCDFRAPENIDKIVYRFCNKSLKSPGKDPDAGKD